MATLVKPRAVNANDKWRYVARSYLNEDGQLLNELTNITGFMDFVDSETGNILFSHHFIAASSQGKVFISEQRLSQRQVEDEATLRDTFFWLRRDVEENVRFFFNSKADGQIAA